MNKSRLIAFYTIPKEYKSVSVSALNRTHISMNEGEKIVIEFKDGEITATLIEQENQE